MAGVVVPGAGLGAFRVRHGVDFIRGAMDGRGGSKGVSKMKNLLHPYGRVPTETRISFNRSRVRRWYCTGWGDRPDIWERRGTLG